jgi:hypothetical protein
MKLKLKNKTVSNGIFSELTLTKFTPWSWDLLQKVIVDQIATTFHLSWSVNVHDHVSKNTPLVPVLSEMTPVYIITPSSTKTCPIYFHLCMPKSPKVPHLQVSWPKFCVHFSYKLKEVFLWKLKCRAEVPHRVKYLHKSQVHTSVNYRCLNSVFVIVTVGTTMFCHNRHQG